MDKFKFSDSSARDPWMSIKRCSVSVTCQGQLSLEGTFSINDKPNPKKFLKKINTEIFKKD